MAKPSKKGKKHTVRKAPAASSRHKLLVGGLVVSVILALAVGIRLYMQGNLAPRLQGAMDGHYTRGKAGAPVVLKEFSDFT